MSNEPGRRFTDEELFEFREKFYAHMRDEDIKALENTTDHTRLKEKAENLEKAFLDFVEKVTPLLEDKRDEIGALRKAKAAKNVVQYVLFWPLALFGLLRAIEWLERNFPKIFDS